MVAISGRSCQQPFGHVQATRSAGVHERRADKSNHSDISQCTALPVSSNFQESSSVAISATTHGATAETVVSRRTFRGAANPGSDRFTRLTAREEGARLTNHALA